MPPRIEPCSVPSENLVTTEEGGLQLRKCCDPTDRDFALFLEILVVDATVGSNQDIAFPA